MPFKPVTKHRYLSSGEVRRRSERATASAVGSLLASTEYEQWTERKSKRRAATWAAASLWLGLLVCIRIIPSQILCILGTSSLVLAPCSKRLKAYAQQLSWRAQVGWLTADGWSVTDSLTTVSDLSHVYDTLRTASAPEGDITAAVDHIRVLKQVLWHSSLFLLALHSTAQHYLHST